MVTQYSFIQGHKSSNNKTEISYDSGHERKVQHFSWSKQMSENKHQSLACENSRVAFRKTPLGLGAKKDNCFGKLISCAIVEIVIKILNKTTMQTLRWRILLNEKKQTKNNNNDDDEDHDSSDDGDDDNGDGGGDDDNNNNNIIICEGSKGNGKITFQGSNLACLSSSCFIRCCMSVIKSPASRRKCHIEHELVLKEEATSVRKLKKT